MRKNTLLTAAAGLAALLAQAGPNSAAAQTRTTLDIYVVDVEGGNATLFVPPSGETVLIDTGNVAPAAAVRDAERIVAAAKDAGITQIDHLITTHWHGDHFGGMAEVNKRIPIKHYIDHGPTVQPQPASDEFLAKVYPALVGAAKRTIAKPGDTIAVKGLDWRIVSSGGEVQKTALPGAGAANPYCASFKPQPVDTTENAQSVGSIISFGKFRLAHLGDLTQNKEFDLLCPTNRVGSIDLFVVSHHGLAVSNSEVLVHGIRPRVAVVNNGTRKGALPDVMKTLFSSPGLEDIWQIHFSQLSGQEYTVPGMFIANLLDQPSTSMPIAPIAAPAPGPNTPPPPAHDGPAYWIKVSAQADGTFTVTNARNKFSKTYAAKPGS
jgi:beta-lactamase superfamily II metal-dependent hydrolase